MRSSLWDNGVAYILVSGTVITDWEGADDVTTGLEERNNGLIFKNFGLFIDCKIETNNAQIDHGKWKSRCCDDNR